MRFLHLLIGRAEPRQTSAADIIKLYYIWPHLKGTIMSMRNTITVLLVSMFNEPFDIGNGLLRAGVCTALLQLMNNTLDWAKKDLFNVTCRLFKKLIDPLYKRKS